MTLLTQNELASNEVAVTKLNEALRGERAAVETYVQALEKVGTDPRADHLRTIRADHMEAVQELKDEIVRLGGKPDDTSGAWGTWAETVMGAAKIFGNTTAVRALREGEEHGEELFKDIAAHDHVGTGVRDLMRSKYIPRQQRHIRSLSLILEKIA